MSHSPLPPLPSSALAHESLYVGIDVGRQSHVAGFISNTLLQRHTRFEGCPVFAFEQSREGFRALIKRISTYTPMTQCFVLLEKTGHYHLPLVQYLQEMDITVYLMHVQTRLRGMLKTDKRDALILANRLYNQLEKGVQVANKLELVRLSIPPTETAVLIRSLIRHRYELARECAQRKNKLTAICDQLFPELLQVFKNPNASGALALRQHFPTASAVASASLPALIAQRIGHHPSTAKLLMLQELAMQSIGTKDPGRLRGLVLEQDQLITELKLLQQHLDVLDEEIAKIMEHSREGKILLSFPCIGPLQAATLVAAIGHIENFPTAAALKSYFGWAPDVAQSGKSLDYVALTHKGNRTAKQMLYFIVCNAIKSDTEWAKIYQRLVPLKCSYDERRKEYVGKKKVMGRIAGQIISTIYALLKRDAEMLAKAKGKPLPEPMGYDAEIHRKHRNGQYRSQKSKARAGSLTQLVSTQL